MGAKPTHTQSFANPRTRKQAHIPRDRQTDALAIVRSGSKMCLAGGGCVVCLGEVLQARKQQTSRPLLKKDSQTHQKTILKKRNLTARTSKGSKHICSTQWHTCARIRAGVRCVMATSCGREVSLNKRIFNKYVMLKNWFFQKEKYLYFRNNF